MKITKGKSSVEADMKYATCLAIVLYTMPAAANNAVIIPCGQVVENASDRMTYELQALPAGQVMVGLLHYHVKTIGGEFGNIRTTGECAVEIAPQPEPVAVKPPVKPLLKPAPVVQQSMHDPTLMAIMQRKQCAEAMARLGSVRLSVDEIPASCLP